MVSSWILSRKSASLRESASSIASPIADIVPDDQLLAITPYPAESRLILPSFFDSPDLLLENQFRFIVSGPRYFIDSSLIELYRLHFPMVFVKTFLRVSSRSAVATSSALVPGVCPRFFAVMCLTPVPGVSFAFTSAEFQDPVDSHLFRHRGDPFVSRHSTASTATCSSAFSPPIVINRTYGASEAVIYAEFLDLVHTLLFKHCAAHSGPCVRFLLVFRLCRRMSPGILVVPPCSSLSLVIDRLFRRFQSFSSACIVSLRFSDVLSASVLDLSSLLPGFGESLTPPGLNRVAMEILGEHSWLDLKIQLMLPYNSLPRPPENCIDSCSWHTDHRSVPSKGELTLALLLNHMELCATDCSVSLHSVTQFCAVGLMLLLQPEKLSLLDDTQTIRELLCVSLVCLRIRHGIQELLPLFQQMDMSFACSCILMPCLHSFKLSSTISVHMRLLQFQQILTFVCQRLVDILTGLLFQFSASQAQLCCYESPYGVVYYGDVPAVSLVHEYSSVYQLLIGDSALHLLADQRFLHLIVHCQKKVFAPSALTAIHEFLLKQILPPVFLRSQSPDRSFIAHIVVVCCAHFPYGSSPRPLDYHFVFSITLSGSSCSYVLHVQDESAFHLEGEY